MGGCRGRAEPGVRRFRRFPMRWEAARCAHPGSRTARRSGRCPGARATRDQVVDGAFTHPFRVTVRMGAAFRGGRCAHPRLISVALSGHFPVDGRRGPAGRVVVEGRAGAGPGGAGLRDADFSPRGGLSVARPVARGWKPIVRPEAQRWRVGNRPRDGGRGILGWQVRSAAIRHCAGQIVARPDRLPSDAVAFSTPRGVTEISRG